MMRQPPSTLCAPPPSLPEKLFACIAIVMVYDVLPLGFFGTGVEVSSMQTTSIEHQIAHALLFLGSSFFLIFSIARCGNLPAVRWELLALIGLVVASTLWSLRPAETFKLSLGLAGTTILGVYIAYRFRFPDIMVLLWVASTIMILGCVVAFVAFPENAIVHDPKAPGNYQLMWRGVFGNKNQLGAAAVVAIITFSYCTVLFSRMSAMLRFVNITFLMVSIAVFVMADAVSSYVTISAVFIGIASLLFVKSAGMARYPLAMVIAWIVILSLFGVQALVEYLAPVLGRDPTLTNRTLIWEFSFRMIEQQPLLGYGYAVFWDFFRNSVRSGQQVFHAHNGLIQTFLDVGLLGGCILLLLFARIARRCLSVAFSFPGILSTWPASVLIVLVVGNIAEASVLRAYDMQWWLFVVVATMYARREAVYPTPSRDAAVANPGVLARGNL